MTCFSCKWSIVKEGQLWCRLWDWLANLDCLHFVYEPGTDEAERQIGTGKR